MTMRCGRCNKDNPEGVAFCGYCGTKLEVEVTGGKTCPKCGNQNPTDFLFCAACGSALPREVEVLSSLPPFEDRVAYGGFFRALWQTWVQACFYPKKFFTAVGNGQRLLPAMLFMILVGLFTFVLGIFGGCAGAALLAGIGRPEEDMTLVAATTAGVGMWIVIYGWFYVPIGGLIFHLFLWIVGGAKKEGSVVTLRVFAYSHAPYIFAFMPFCGWCVAEIWRLVLTVVGLAVAHRTEIWRVILAILMQLILCFGIPLLVALLLR